MSCQGEKRCIFLKPKFNVILDLVIENKRDTFYEVLFNFTRVILSGTSPSTYNYSLAKGSLALVYPFGYPHSLTLSTLAHQLLDNQLCI